MDKVKEKCIKSKLKVSRTLTINVGNFESIKPSVEIELDNVPIKKIDEVYQALGNVLDGLFQLEQANLYVELKSIHNVGIKKHIGEIVNQDFDIFNKHINISLNSIQKIIKGD